MNKAITKTKTSMLGLAAQIFPDRVGEVTSRAEKMKDDLIEKMSAIEDEEDKAVELMAFTLFILDVEETLEKI